jgi:type IX secretion system PorP/SprF family membrane protein
MKKLVFKSILFVSAVLMSSGVWAQQEGIMTQFLQGPGVYNPAYAGSKDALSVLVMSRLQWTGFEGAPRTNTLNIHSPIADSKLGVGLTVINDKIGPVNQNTFSADLSYKLVVGYDASLRIGIRGSGQLFSADLTSLRTGREYDPSLIRNVESVFLPNAGAGIYFNTPKYFAGVGTPNILSNEIRVNDFTTNRAYRQEMHFFVMAGGIFDLSPSILLKPAIKARYVFNAPIAIDVSANALLYDKVWVGLMYRYKGALGGSIQFQLNDQFAFGCAYDRSVDYLGEVNNGTYEIMMTYDFIYSGTRVRSPRYF